jgi:hypothetical protein
MALGDRDPSKSPAYAEDTHPRDARACVVVDDFSELFPVLLGWRRNLGEEITAYAMKKPTDSRGRPDLNWSALWDDEGPTYRLDSRPGGYVQVSDYSPSRESADRSRYDWLYTTARRTGMHAIEKLLSALSHLTESERTALIQDYRNAVLSEAASAVEDTDDERCGVADCCGLHAEDFAEVVRNMCVS